MSSKFIRCELCQAKIPMETCQLAAYRTVIDSKEYVFCCAECAKRYKEKKK